MAKQHPVLEVLVVPEGGGARIYVADWCSPATRAELDSQKSAFVSTTLDLAGLDRFMWGCDAPYRAATTNGRTELVARGRSAIVLDGWIFELLSL
jgi:hypothetical protein